MANLRAIRKRISSVKSTQQITRAMKMVSAAKLRRAQEAILAARHYAIKMHEVALSVASRVESSSHPLLTSREVKRLALLVVTSDRGLCGSFNAGLSRHVHRHIAERQADYDEIVLFIVGRKGRDFFRRRGEHIHKEYLNVLGTIGRWHSEMISNDLLEGFVNGEFDEVQVAYNEFRSAISQVVRIERLLPLVLNTPEDASDDKVSKNEIEYLYEPDKREILELLLPRFFETQIFRVLLESVAGEHGARMTAMDSATNNSVDMIARLTLQMNRARQAAITTELTEIVSGAEALKG
ncbi:MAG: ATP synthase F1 subunit gamma [Syntrophorhabdaceae bacterium]|nr:ATP synthase F1 subunit gamma [Syntrophorhabdaceae bacterium]